MPYSRLLTPRNLTFLSLFSVGGGYLLVRSKSLAYKPSERAPGDYSVTVDRSGGGI